jgi:hypothetical protein
MIHLAADRTITAHRWGTLGIASNASIKHKLNKIITLATLMRCDIELL